MYKGIKVDALIIQLKIWNESLWLFIFIANTTQVSLIIVQL